MKFEERIQAYIDAMIKLKKDGAALYNEMIDADEHDDLTDRQWEIVDELENMDMHFKCSLRVLTGDDSFYNE